MKNNKRIGSVLCAVVLGASLTLASAPAAFAAEGDGSFTENSAKTTVKLTSDDGQLIATVPISAAVVANPNGGAFTVVPSEGVYKATNSSDFPIYITNVAAEIPAAAATAGWTLKNTALSSTDTATGAIGDIQMTVKGKDVNVGAITNADLAIPKKTDASTPGELDLTVAGTTTPLKSFVKDAQDVITITYTISAVDPTPAP